MDTILPIVDAIGHVAGAAQRKHRGRCWMHCGCCSVHNFVCDERHNVVAGIRLRAKRCEECMERKREDKKRKHVEQK